MEISVYTFEERDSVTGKYSETPDGYHTQDYIEAKEYAQKYQLRVINNTFTWEESEPVDDFTTFDEEDEEEEDEEEEEED